MFRVWTCIDAMMHSRPLELFDPIGIKSEVGEYDLKKSINNRFQQALVKGMLSLKSFAKPNNLDNSNPTSLVDDPSNLKEISKFITDIEVKEESIVPKQEETHLEKFEAIEAVVEPVPKKKKKLIKRSHNFASKKKCSRPQIGKAMYYCHVCNDRKKLTRNELKEHFLRHDMPEAINSPSHIKKARAIQNRIARPPLHRCEVCCERFSSQTELLEHLESHEDQYFCDICNLGFKTIIDHTCHMQEHNEDKLFRCPLCAFTCDKRYQIRAHLYYQHEHFKKYKCDICNKGFSLYSYLEEHKNYHTGEKPFQCDICGLSFMYTRYLSSHKVRRHKEVDKISLECPVCKKVLFNKRSYRSHLQSHDSSKHFVCDVCGKTFTTRHGIVLHQKSHGDSRPYKCKYCDKSFKQSCAKRDHERIHTGEKPHKCPHCGKGFVQRTSMVRHTHSQTGKRPYTCHLCKKGFIAKSELANHLKTTCHQG